MSSNSSFRRISSAYGLGNCVRPEDGSLKGAETCRLHRCYKLIEQIVVLDGYLVYTFIRYYYTQRDGKHQMCDCLKANYTGRCTGNGELIASFFDR
jgi:hypothetical protein